MAHRPNFGPIQQSGGWACVARIEPEHDPQTKIRRIPTVFEKEKCQDGQAPQPWHLLNLGKSKTA
jgi:hypothetical protein